MHESLQEEDHDEDDNCSTRGLHMEATMKRLESENRSQREHLEMLLHSKESKNHCPSTYCEGDVRSEEEVSALKQLLHDTNCKLEDMTYQRDDLRERLEVEIGASTETERDMENQIDKLNSTICDLEGKNAELKATLHTTSTKLENYSRLEEEVQILKEQLEKTKTTEQLSNESTAVSSPSASLTRELHDCKEELEAAQAAIQTYEMQLEYHSQKTGAWEAEVQRLNARIANLQVDLENAFVTNEQNSIELQNEVDRLNSEFDSQAALYTEELETLRSQLEDKENLQNEVGNGKLMNICSVLGVTEVSDVMTRINQLQEAESDLLLLKESGSTLQLQSDESDVSAELLMEKKCELESIVADLQSRMEELTQKHLEATEKASGLEADLQEADDLICVLQDKIASTEVDCASMSERIKDLTAEIDCGTMNLETITTERDELLDALAATTSQLEINKPETKPIELENKYLAAEARCQALVNEVADLQARLVASHKEADVFAEGVTISKKEGDRDMGKLTAVLGQKEAHISQLLQEVEDLQVRASTAEQSVKILLDEGSSGAAENEVFLKKSKQLNSQIQFLTGEKEHLAQLLATSEKEKKQVEYELEKCDVLLKQTVESKRQELSALTDEVEQLRKEVSFLRGQDRDLQEAKRELSISNEKFKNLTANFEELSTRMSTVDKSDVEEELNALRDINSLLEEQVESLEHDVSESRNRYGRLKEELNQVMSELNNISNQASSLETENEELKKKVLDLESVTAATTDANFLEEELEKLKQSYDNILSSAAKDKSELMTAIGNLKQQILEKDKEISILSSEVSTSESNELINELNSLMEQKMNAEAREAELTSECKALRSELSDYDKKSSQELTSFMRVAEEEMDALRSRHETEMAGSNAKIQQLEENLERSTTALKDLQTRLDATQQEVSRLEESSQNHASAAHIKYVEEMEAVEEEKDALQMELSRQSRALQEKAIECTRIQEKLAALQRDMDDTVATKDQRIAHLEKSKLTKDQYEKIKQVREDRNKKTEECKIYKKQLVSLKSAYDDLQRRSQSSSTVENTAELAAMQVRLSENTAQLDQARVVCDSLKSKLKECSRQLQEYETEKQGVINILKTCGIDVSGLMVNESGSEDSVLEQDLAEAVGTLAQKWKYLSTSYGDIREKLKVIENEKLEISCQFDSQNVQKAALERKVDSLKMALQDAKEECAELSNKLRQECETKISIASELEEARASAQSSKSAVNVEVQMLEEENIELLKENKELRGVMATYKAQVERFSAGNASSEGLKKRSTCDESSTENQVPSIDTKKPRIHADQSAENCPPVKVKPSQTSAENGTVREFGTELDANRVAVEPTSSRGGRKGRRSTKIVGSTSDPNTPLEEQPGECAQS